MVIGALTYLFFLYLLWPHIERVLYLNELFSLAGFVVFLKFRFLSRNIHAFHIKRGVSGFIVVGVFFLAISYLFYDIHFYGYLRNSQMIYSAFSFFFGLKVFNYIYSRQVSKLSFLGIILFAHLWGEWSYSLAVLAPGFYMRNSTMQRYLLVVLLLFFVAYGESLVMGTSGGTTAIVILFLIVSISFIFLLRKANVAAKWMIGALLGVLLISLPIFLPLTNVLWEDGLQVFHQEIVELLSIEDMNTSWRIGIWVTLISKRFFKEFWGIGMGVSLFPEGIENIFLMNQENDPFFLYTVGAHNSFLTVLIRLGPVGLGMIVMMYWGLVASLRRHVQNWFSRDDILRFSIFLSVLMITAQALVHVIIESPLYSSVFWVSWGLFYKALVTDPQISTSVPSIMVQREC
jgi:hypothetical protein